MQVFKCKICGGNLEFNPGDTVAVCDSCGTKQTLPKLDDERRVNLYDRANHFRRNNEFDKAMGIYEQILNEDGTDAEAYWSIVLCRYGIEYVEDPATHKRLPTVNRAQYTSIFDDDNYKSALQYADPAQKQLYEEEANIINEIQKDILAISQNEEPFDVFICYKETDASGRRTQDSVLANDLYHQLTLEGFKVFFSRITLEDKLGAAYEPYIFAALNSAKVMVVLGTKPEYFNAVWVKNEWARYLALIKNGAKKNLIPAYKDMDPYDLPEEFSHLQAQDMSKLGFMQDLIRGIKKITHADTPKAAVEKETVITSGSINAAPLLKRAFIFLEDHNLASADEYFEKTLDCDPENAMAYLGKMMLQLNVVKKEELIDLPSPFDDNIFFQKVLRYADQDLKNELQGYIDAIYERNEHDRLENLYQNAKKTMDSAANESEYLEAAAHFDEISDYLDAADLAQKCKEMSKIARCDAIYREACSAAEIGKEEKNLKKRVSAFENSIFKFEQIPEYKNAQERMIELKREVEGLNYRIDKKHKKNKITAIIVSCSTIVAVAILIVLVNVVFPEMKYNSANKCLNSGQYADALAIYEELGEYKDSSEKVIPCRYQLASSQLENEEYQNAYDNFSLLKEYEDSKSKFQESGYGYAQALMAEKKYQEALDVLDSVGEYKKSSELKEQCYLDGAKQFYDNKDYKNAVIWYQHQKLSEKDRFYIESCYQYGVQFLNSGEYGKAIEQLNKTGNYSDAKEKINEAKYAYTLANKNSSSKTTYNYLKDLKAAGYKDSEKIYEELYAWKVDIIANDDKNDKTTSLSSISKYSNFYFHISLSGGEPGDETKIKYTGFFPDGDTNSGIFDGKWSNGDSGTCWFYYTNPAYGKQGTFTLKVYDNNGNMIGTESIKITG